jgi:hypothetical protein
VTAGFNARVVSQDYGLLRVQFNPTSNPACEATLEPYCGDNGFWLEVTHVNPAYVATPLSSGCVALPSPSPSPVIRFHAHSSMGRQRQQPLLILTPAHTRFPCAATPSATSGCSCPTWSPGRCSTPCSCGPWPHSTPCGTAVEALCLCVLGALQCKVVVAPAAQYEAHGQPNGPHAGVPFGVLVGAPSLNACVGLGSNPYLSCPPPICLRAR